ncbi:site-specific integrase [Blastococcus sp. TF02A-26]|uniref:site-specific integrase n=1 Tax=Blastococcus sp. TF02A-26 TaxID=2250577 RepID=UPI001F318C06|nr:site-specific integrase [Blastococcus sp. TF02A-26]
MWQPAKAAARLPERATFHDLRAFSATAAARQGATVKELMHRLGHSSVAAAMKYQRAEAERDRSLAAAMSAAVEGQRTAQG